MKQENQPLLLEALITNYTLRSVIMRGYNNNEDKESQKGDIALVYWLQGL